MHTSNQTIENCKWRVCNFSAHPLSLSLELKENHICISNWIDISHAQICTVCQKWMNEWMNALCGVCNGFISFAVYRKMMRVFVKSLLNGVAISLWRHVDNDLREKVLFFYLIECWKGWKLRLIVRQFKNVFLIKLMI